MQYKNSVVEPIRLTLLTKIIRIKTLTKQISLFLRRQTFTPYEMSAIKELTLYSYFYSSASWRVRAVMALKKIPYKYVTVQLLENDQHTVEFLKINPMHQVPALKVVDSDDKTHVLTQSLAIIQYLEENYPENSVYPQDPTLRAKSRAIADTISGGIQPLQNLETLMKYGEPLGLGPHSPEERKKIAQFWISRKLENLEVLVKTTAGKYCVGDQVTIADICLVPQMFNARRFEIDTTKYPVLKEIDDRMQDLDIIKKSCPQACPEAPK